MFLIKATNNWIFPPTRITATLEKKIANKIVDTENKVESDVTRKLSEIMDKHLATIQKQKRTVTKLMQDKETAKSKHQVSAS